MKAQVQREGDRVWIEGAEGWFVGDKESSVHAAQAEAMRVAGEDITYEYLLGASALAFRLQVHKEGLCPSSPHSFCGFLCVGGSLQALPWNVRVFEVKPDDAEGVRAARQAIVESIDRGVPVQYGSEEDGLIVGYQKGGEEWIAFHPFREGGTKEFVETTWPWGIAVFTERKAEQPSRRDIALAGLRQAVEMAHAEEGGEKGGYHIGFKAWDEYVNTLRSLDEADEKTRAESMQGNAWIYECLAQFRSAAAIYLRDVAGEFSSTAKKHLLRAADLYDRMGNRVLRDEENCVTAIAPNPWGLKEGETWTSEQRQEQIRRIEAALPLEREAIGEIEKALAIIGG